MLKNKGHHQFDVQFTTIHTGNQPLTKLMRPCDLFTKTADGQFAHHRVQRYFEEGNWNSGGSGVRGHVDAYHRTLSTIVNTLIETGFRIERLLEPQFDVEEQESNELAWHQNIPRMLFVSAKLD